jgi:hypothetical protein
VKSIIKVKVLPEIRLAIGSEIKKHYAAWRFLGVMDSSYQSLNQVSLSFPPPPIIYKSNLFLNVKVLPEVKQIQKAQRCLNYSLNTQIHILF